MDGSMLFDRWRQRVLPQGHIGATWRIRLNLCILRPTRVHNRNGQWIGLAVCTAYCRKCLYLTMGAPIHQNCPFSWGIWTSHVTRDAFGPCELTTQTAPRSVQPSLHRWPRSVSIVYNSLPVSPSKLLLPMLASAPHVIVGWFGPPDSGTHMVTWSFQPFFVGLTSVTHWQSDTETDGQTTLLDAMQRNKLIMRNYVGYGKANNFATINLLSRYVYVQNI